MKSGCETPACSVEQINRCWRAFALQEPFRLLSASTEELDTYVCPHNTLEELAKKLLDMDSELSAVTLDSIGGSIDLDWVEEHGSRWLHKMLHLATRDMPKHPWWRYVVESISVEFPSAKALFPVGQRMVWPCSNPLPAAAEKADELNSSVLWSAWRLNKYCCWYVEQVVYVPPARLWADDVVGFVAYCYSAPRDIWPDEVANLIGDKI